MKTEFCLICGKPIPDYEPKFCCSGFECTCGGRPIEPCVCSARCDAAVFEFIGLPFDERRQKAGIKKYHHKRRTPIKLPNDYAYRGKGLNWFRK